MPSRINTTLSPLAAEYLQKKKQTSESKKSMSAKKQAKKDSPQGDTVSLSSEQPDDLATPYTGDTISLSPEQVDDNSSHERMKPSQPVTLEEKLALMSEFSIRI